MDLVQLISNKHKNTLTILKAKRTSYIFGGFTSIGWDSSGQFKSDPSAFLFSLTNRYNKPSKMRQIHTTSSIYCHSQYGPTFGSGFDLYICSSANTTAGSRSNLGRSYQHPQPNQGNSYLTHI
jgi:hypothetical protein